MRNDTRKLFTAYLGQVALLNRVESATATFSVDPTIQQKLETKIQESSEFLTKINIIGVDEQEGEKVGLGVGSTVASRTNTTLKKREPRAIGTLSSDKYRAEQTDFDTYVNYKQLDAWAKFPDFQTRLSSAIAQRQALDRIQIGFYGTTAAEQTDRTAHPLLEDVNIGWLQQYRTHAPDRVLKEGAVAGKITIGKAGDFKNIDALVYDAIQLLDPWFRRNPGLVVLTGRELVHDKFLALVNKDQDATNTLASDLIISQRRVGGLPLYEVPYIPEGTILITTLANLSVYWQIGARRRYLKEEPEWNRVSNFESSNEAYVVEEYGLGCLLENITPVEDAGSEG
ncbi:phage major capsid protein, P2 family [Pseudomonas fluorescens]|jgi:P2 family phage major capsid protein|uniref:phage major capsid protein, P2 family n=1 Tax=Pseudomonas TaxID=286 RepID=UPI000BA3327B|nr:MULTISPECIES: phage major capsid protein, P2 family [Pseudomonas]MBD8236979.1 phage major capsid protein, P2 family [Pseudomonas fluorescens]MDY0898240.1 phage major capsid protein, P2 family [Pseudomonas fluorescens]